ncbi:hypothetical protein CPC16_007790 [Podila verticillata]|nr:hypothetical protein BGZ52_007163 [Haplosporangium bisporale]KAF9385925.1 hypothetical protein CPC16_007790 [Podila verticillata]KAI9237642.1 MAG: hypothetical protein BYD32DRAFT_415971 [Podila humilis]
MASSLRIQPLSSKNRPGVVQVVFDQHMRAVPALYNFLKLRPITLILWTAISTAILKARRTNLYDYAELMMTLAVSVLLAHGGLFLALLYDASSSSPGPEVVGRLDEFVDQDASSSSTASTILSKDAQVDTESVNVSSAKKRSTVASSKPTSITETNTTTSTIASAKKEDNLFWVLEKNQEAIGSIGALVNKAKGEAQLVSWAVSTKNQRSGAGTLLLKTAMEQLCTKKGSITVVRAVVQGHQVPALRIFYSLGFKQLERTPEWMSERVVLEFQCKDWGKKK